MVLHQMRDMLTQAGDLLAPGESVKSKLRQVSLALGLEYGRCRRYWYEVADRVPAEEYLSVQNRLGLLRQRFLVAPLEMSIDRRMAIAHHIAERRRQVAVR
jgi:hypothetical protein